MPAKWRSTVCRTTYFSRLCLLLMFPDIFLFIEDLYSNTKEFFFFLNTTSLIQPMVQGIIAACKENLCPGYWCKWGRHWEDTGAVVEGLLQLWLHQRACLSLWWCHERMYEWHLEEDTQKSSMTWKDVPWMKRLQKSVAVVKMANTLSWVWMSMTSRVS